MAVRGIAKVVDAYALDKRTKRMFRTDGAFPYDVLVELIDPRNTSRTRSKCGPCEKGNRGNQSEFRCRSCGHQAHADINAAENIRQGRCKEAERDVVENRLSHSFRFRLLSAAVTSPRFRRGWFTCETFVASSGGSFAIAQSSRLKTPARFSRHLRLGPAVPGAGSEISAVRPHL
jgi:hypothetical protein